MSQKEQELTSIQKYEALKEFIERYATINVLRNMLIETIDNHDFNYNAVDELWNDYLKPIKTKKP